MAFGYFKDVSLPLEVMSCSNFIQRLCSDMSKLLSDNPVKKAAGMCSSSHGKSDLSLHHLCKHVR